jgi:hypothetical protein
VIPACRLWRKTSAKGNEYLIGRLGGIRVLVMPNTRPEDGDDSTHTLMLAEAPQRDATRGQATPAEPSEPTPPATRQVTRRGEDKRPIDDDPVPF